MIGETINAVSKLEKRETAGGRTNKRLSEVTLVYAANSTYALPLAVSLVSVVRNLSANTRLNVYVLVSNMPDEHIAKIERSTRDNLKPSCEVEFFWKTVDLTMFERLFKNSDGIQYITIDTYSRLLIGDLLPPDLDQVIYLDADTVVLGDLCTLAKPIEGFTIAAVRGCMFPYVSSSRAGRPVVFNWSSIGIAANARYFQCGVLVINLRAWRNGKAAERAMDYLSEYWEQIQLADQGVLNAVLHDSWTPLDQRWNQTTTVLFPEYWTASRL